MEVLIFPDATSLARKSADLVESQIKTFPAPTTRTLIVSLIIG